MTESTAAISQARLLILGFAAFLPTMAFSRDNSMTITSENHNCALQLFDQDPSHVWNRLHAALFEQKTDSHVKAHLLDPILLQPAAFLLEGDRHVAVINVLDEFLSSKHDQPPLNKLVLQRELWAAFDSVAWYPDEWVYHSKHEPLAISLRGRLAQAIDRIALTGDEIDQLPDNYRSSVQSLLVREPTNLPPEHVALLHDYIDVIAPLLTEEGPWVSIQERNPTERQPIAEEHSEAVGSRSAFAVLLNLPNGREATLSYLQELTADRVIELPAGTKVALVRSALAIDRDHHIQVTKFVESVQFRTVTASQPTKTKPIDQTMKALELVLDRGSPYFATSGTMRVVGNQDEAVPFNSQSKQIISGFNSRHENPRLSQLQSCVFCHQGNELNSVLSMHRGLQRSMRVTDAQRQPVALQAFNGSRLPFDWHYAVAFKTKRYDWGLLQGLLEGSR